MTPNTCQLSAISQLFSSTVFREMAENGHSTIFADLFGMSGIGDVCHPQATVAEGFNTAFAVLRRTGLRDEYVYRAAITQKVLMGKHSLNTACMLTEFRTGACKADLVILNGTATVYEIKSERDSLARLVNQVANYMKVFAAVNVIASEAHVDAVMSKVPEDVGVMCLLPRYQIRTLREAATQPQRICPMTAFESLRAAEAKMVLRKLGAHIPKVPNTQFHSATRKIFAEQVPSAVHQAIVETLRRTRNLAPLNKLVEQLPQSLHAAALSIKVRRSDHDRLVQAVSTRLIDAMNWG